MYQRKLRNRSQAGRCAKHGRYPLNVMYRGTQFAGVCPKCRPQWEDDLRKLYESMQRASVHSQEGEKPHE